jgi:hypothetical protein
MLLLHYKTDKLRQANHHNLVIYTTKYILLLNIQHSDCSVRTVCVAPNGSNCTGVQFILNVVYCTV